MYLLQVFVFLSLVLCPFVSAHADLFDWQSEVAAGSSASATRFSVVNGTSAVEINVGALSGARTFEFIVNAGTGGASQALLGDRTTNLQGLKFEQWNNLETYGITDFGVVDWDSGVTYTIGTDIHIAYVFDGTDTTIWVNGSSVATSNLDLVITGETGLGAARNATDDGFFDLLDGDIKGFASYDSALSGLEINEHSAAFFSTVPEPASAGILSFLCIMTIRRNRKC